MKDDVIRDGSHSPSCDHGVTDRSSASAPRLDSDNDVLHARAIVLFTDVSGFSTFAEEREACVVATQIRAVMDIQEREIEAQNGHVDKFIGDGLMAFWLVPKDGATDRAQSAVEAALALIDKVRAYFRSQGSTLDIRVGLHMGPVVVGTFGSNRKFSSLLGETVNLASKYVNAKADSAGRTIPALRMSEGLFTQIKAPRVLAHISGQKVTFTSKDDREYVAYTGF